MEVKDVANYLLYHCFIPAQAEDAVKQRYTYAIHHIDELQQLFKPLGFRVVQYTNPAKIIALVNDNEGTKPQLLKYETVMLLIFFILYLQKREKLNVDANHVTVTVDEIMEEYQKVGLPRKLDHQTLDSVMRTLRKYNFAAPLGKLDSGSSKIEIYPTVLLALPDQNRKAAVEDARTLLARQGRRDAGDLADTAYDADYADFEARKESSVGVVYDDDTPYVPDTEPQDAQHEQGGSTS